MKKSYRNIKYIRVMDSKDKINYKLNTIPSILNMDSDNSQNSYDFNFYDTKSNSYFSNDLIYDVFDAEFKANFPEIKNNLNKIQCNKYSITRFSFEIISGKKSLDHNIINDIKKPIIFNMVKTDNKIIGRKVKRDPNKNGEIKGFEVHDKYADDNIRKKCKNLVMKYLFEFINKKIDNIYKDNKGYGDNRKEIKILGQSDKVNSTLIYDKEFLEKKLADIFSQNISSRCNNYSLDHNKKIIESLMNEEDKEKRDYFTKLFNFKFLDCTKYFCGEKNFPELEGLSNLESIKDEIVEKHGEKYYDLLLYYFKNYENIIEKKMKNRRKEKKRNEK